MKYTIVCGWIKGTACGHIWHIHPAVAPTGSLLLKTKNWQSLDSKGKWKMLKCRNQSMETKARKQKYGSEKKSRLSVSSALLTHDCVFWRCVAKGWLSPSYVRAVFQGSQTAVHGHHYHDATVSLGGQTQPKANDKWVNIQATDASVVIVPHWKSSPEVRKPKYRNGSFPFLYFGFRT